MPFHLDSLSRRRFFQGSAVLLLSANSRTQAAQGDSETWALLSDTHIAADREFVSRQGVNLADHLTRVVAEVVAEKDTLSGVIIDGDCAFNDGQNGDYETLLELLAPLTEADLPIHFTLGNHDDRDNFFDQLNIGRYARSMEGKHCSVIETPVANLVLLDSLRFVNKVEGEFGEAQLEWLAAYLDANPGKPAILIGHHYPQVFREDVIPSDKPIKISGLVDSDAFLDLIRPLSEVKAYVYGHSHNWATKKDANGIQQINLPPTSYVFDESRPSGWVRASISGTGIEMELRSLDPTHPQHGKKTSLSWR